MLRLSLAAYCCALLFACAGTAQAADKVSVEATRRGALAVIEQSGEVGFLFLTFPIEVTLASTERPPQSAGAMRQWGRHATAFVGRRHFDDANLFEKRFSFDLK